MTVDAIVLAGGASTRFGGDKLAASIDGDTVLGRAVATAHAVADRVVIVLGPADPDPGLPGVSIARDPVAHGGPLAGLVTGLEALPDAGVVLVLAGDMPRVHAAVLGLLVGALSADPAAGAARLAGDPVPTLPLGVRSATALPAASALLAHDRRSLRALLDTVPTAVVPAETWRALDPRGSTLLDIDAPADLEIG